MKVRDHRDLVVWQKAMDLVVIVYRLTGGLPKQERFALADQLRRAAISVPANIAEGNGRVHRGEYVHHLSIAYGSISEVSSLLEISLRLDYFTPDQLGAASELIDHIRRMLHRLMSVLRA
ncbi:MAG: four helix bundle protein [Gemmatimonadaceae bacterium]